MGTSSSSTPTPPNPTPSHTATHYHYHYHNTIYTQSILLHQRRIVADHQGQRQHSCALPMRQRAHAELRPLDTDPRMQLSEIHRRYCERDPIIHRPSPNRSHLTEAINSSIIRAASISAAGRISRISTVSSPFFTLAIVIAGPPSLYSCDPFLVHYLRMHPLILHHLQ